MIKIAIALVGLFLGVMWLVFDVFTPIPQAQQLRGIHKVGLSEQGPALAPATAELRTRAIRTPLALLVLDVSGSMKSDKGFKETFAAEIFTYFFAQLAMRDVPEAERGKVNVAMIFFPGARSDSGTDRETWDGKSWLTLATSAASYESESVVALDKIVAALDRHIGHPGGADRRQGGGTPHDAATMACDKVITEYRREFGAEANIFAVYFTDEPMSESQKKACSGIQHLDFVQVGIMQNTGGGAYELRAKSPGVELIHHLWQNQEPHIMIDRFLAGLKLEPRDATSDFANGYPREKINQLLPLVIRLPGTRKFRRPKLVTDTGVEIPLRGSGDTFYVAIDPANPALATAQRLHLEGADRAVITLYSRAQWQLSVTPPIYGLLDQQQHPVVRLEFTGQDMPQLVAGQTASIQDKGGRVAAIVALAWDSTQNCFTGPLPDIKKLLGRTEYFAQWQEPGGDPLRYPFRISTDFDIRFLDETNLKTGREIRGVRMIPKQ